MTQSLDNIIHFRLLDETYIRMTSSHSWEYSQRMQLRNTNHTKNQIPFEIAALQKTSSSTQKNHDTDRKPQSK